MPYKARFSRIFVRLGGSPLEKLKIDLVDKLHGIIREQAAAEVASP